MSISTAFTVLRRSDAARRRRPGAAFWIGASIIAGVLLLAAWMTVFPPYGPLATTGGSLEGPSGAHLLGTDNVGRDSLVRLALAGRTSLLISGSAALLAAAIGTALGLIAGYAGGIVDTVIMRTVDALLALPAILVALVVGVIIGNGPVPLVLALGLIFAPTFARVMRAPALALRERDFVLASRLSGIRAPRIVIEHLLPNALTPLLVQFASVASSVVLLEAALSYLGQGVQAPEPSAGRMINEFTRFMQIQPLLVTLPALLIVILSAGWNLLADGIQTFLAPRRAPAFSLVRRGRGRSARRDLPDRTHPAPSTASRKDRS